MPCQHSLLAQRPAHAAPLLHIPFQEAGADLTWKANFQAWKFDNIFDLEGVENYRRKLYGFRNYLGSTEGYSFFNDYYVSKMEELENKYNLIENGQFSVALKPISQKENIFIKILKTLKRIILGKKSEEENTY